MSDDRLQAAIEGAVVALDGLEETEILLAVAGALERLDCNASVIVIVGQLAVILSEGRN